MAKQQTVGGSSTTPRQRRKTDAPKAKATKTEAATAKQETPAAPEKKEKVLPTPAEALAIAKKDNPERYKNVLRVTEQTKDGAPKRVVVACTDKQFKQAPDGTLVTECEGEREIATQDLFQVDSCAWCADRKVRKARRNRAKARDKALRAQLRAMKSA